MSRCQVTFAQDSDSNKRSIGNFAGWDVESVRILDDDEDKDQM